MTSPLSPSAWSRRARHRGANSGIGRTVVLGRADAGAGVAVNCIVDPQDAEKVSHAIEDLGCSAVALKADFGKGVNVEWMLDDAVVHFGMLRVVARKAGLQRDSPFDGMTLDRWNTGMG